ncbi:MAG TPA: tetratricopeptide repeat protein [Polyangiaceae bacterium]
MHGSDGTDDLERLSREQLILKARVLGVERPELMTRVEMRDEIVRRSEPDPVQQKRARGFLGVARDLVASVVEAGLNLPDAAAIIRGEGAREGEWKGPPPVATVTLAEIYAAQGHLDRALRMLDEVLAKEPDHDAARSLRDRLAAGADVPRQPAPRRQRISFADPPESDLSPEPIAQSAPEPKPESESAPEPEPAPAPAPVPAPIPESAAAPPPASPYVLTLAVAGQRQVYWEVPAHTWDALRSRAPHGRAVLRVLSFRTRAGKVERRAHDLSPEAEVGSAVLPGLNADAVVRAALGWESDGRFLPFVIASDLVPGRFRAHPLVGPVAAEVEQRAVAHLSRGAAR